MDWSAMFAAKVVVLGCGNVLFGDDGLGPRVVASLAEEVEAACAAGQPHPLAHVAFVDAGTSVRPLLVDLTLHPVPHLRRLVLLDVVQEKDRELGSLHLEELDSHTGADPAGGFLHHAPTWGLLRKLRDHMGIDVLVLTVQAGHIPELMDDSLSAEARNAFPLLVEKLRELSLV